MLSVTDARIRIERVKTSVDTIRDDITALWQGQAWHALGYADWDELCDAEFAVRIALPREQRRELVADLTEGGMSTRAIGKALGVGNATVYRDRGVSNETPVTGTDGKSYPATIKTTERRSESTTTEHTFDPDTGEILDGDPASQPTALDVPARPPSLNSLFLKGIQHVHVHLLSLPADQVAVLVDESSIIGLDAIAEWVEKAAAIYRSPKFRVLNGGK